MDGSKKKACSNQKKNRDVGSYLKLGGQVIMCGGRSLPLWVGSCPSCPPISYVHEDYCYKYAYTNNPNDKKCFIKSEIKIPFIKMKLFFIELTREVFFSKKSPKLPSEFCRFLWNSLRILRIPLEKQLNSANN